MNRDSDAIESLLLWLLQNPRPNQEPLPSGGYPASDHCRESGNETGSLDSWEHPEVEGPSHLQSFESSQADSVSSEEAQFFALGEIPAVQDYAYNILKRRLQAEIERNPPLFPWESEICDYPIESSDWINSASVPSAVWAAQRQAFRWPIALPESTFMTLLERCQAVIQSTLKPGVQLVQAVEALFPNQSEALNYLAGIVLVSPGRSPRLSALTDSSAAQNLPSSYEDATSAQQMVLSLLAARDILETLTLAVSSSQPQLERVWETAIGPLHLSVVYQAGPEPQLQIAIQLPCSGQAQLQGGQASTLTRRSDAGRLTLTVAEPIEKTPYSLKIDLFDVTQSPLQFVVWLSEAE